ncbi:MAG: hypothetical protein HC892_05290 [Saprospiraceae bacterium]|nr:hypothetical protein [Saprospiraceae bacterium]
MIHSKFGALVFSMILIIILASPIKENWKAKPKDNFPLSYYPMFSKKRDTSYTLNYLVGFDANNKRHCIPYYMVSSGGMNQVRRQINKKCKEGESDKLAKKVARRIANSEKAPFDKLEKVVVMEGTYHLEDYFLADRKAPLKEKIISTQIVDRTWKELSSN